METAVVTNIQGYSVHDGPGIRTVVFLKGCPLACRWCANPENLSPEPELGFLEALCRECGKCGDACGHGAVTPQAGRIDRTRCARCFSCADACFYGALVRYGERMTSAEVLEKVKRDKMFYDSSGGGVTFSGGEPLMRADFVAEVLRLLKNDGISTCIETCGFAPWTAFKKTLPFTDCWYFDLKILDGARHREYTGVSNERILLNAEKLVKSGADVLFRRPLIPGVNDGDKELEATAGFLSKIGGARLQLMPYHRLGQAKYKALGLEYEMPEIKGSELAAERACNLLSRLNISCTISK
ncbi:MAG: glycyl-radical enzyme activating protein [Oscillospiraceae bacterium]|nr:glycyl-radical enzyme activating protein [Oscillospiraceae bacterium]